MAWLRRLGVLSAGLAVLAAGCGSSSRPASGPTTHSSTTARGSGPVDVLYAGSLVDLMEKQVGPAFDAATGYRFTGFSAGSDALASQIKGKVRQGDVFVSASPAVNPGLEGAANGGWVSWYVTFADSPLVLGYNPNGRFAHALRTQPWYRVVTQPGFLLGRTDPATDPKGKLAVTALREAATANHLPSLAGLAASTAGVFPEETLVGRLQAGQLDGGFFYSSEATTGKIPTVPLTGVDLKATYTVTVLNHAPHQAGGQAFVAYLLGAGQAALRRDGFVLVRPPVVSGTGVPPTVQAVLSGG